VSRIRSIVIVASLAVSACGAEPPPPPPLRPVRAETVFSTGGERTRTFPGTARSGTESRLSFRVGGAVLEIPVRVGDLVRPGQLIARLDEEDYSLRVREADAGLQQARAQEQNAEASYQRVRDLFEADNASRADLDGALAAFQSAEASVGAAEQRLQLARQQLSYTRLTAPLAGAVAAVNVEVNENVQAGQSIVLLTSGDELEVEVAVPEALISQISEGDRTETGFDALPGRRFPATVREVGVAVARGASAYPVTVVLDDADPALRSGMAAEVAFTFHGVGRPDVYVVPSFAVGEDDGGRFVYVVEAAPDGEGEGIVHRRAVTVGDLTTEGLEVLSGLRDGDRVVTAGVSRIEDGLRVRLDEAG